jgi:hypothetical protein
MEWGRLRRRLGWLGMLPFIGADGEARRRSPSIAGGRVELQCLQSFGFGMKWKEAVVPVTGGEGAGSGGLYLWHMRAAGGAVGARPRSQRR